MGQAYNETLLFSSLEDNDRKYKPTKMIFLCVYPILAFSPLVSPSLCMLQTPVPPQYFYLRQHNHHFHGNMFLKLQIEDCNLLSKRGRKWNYYYYYFFYQLVATFKCKIMSQGKSFKCYVIIKAILKLSMVISKNKES